jgi:hypothetical protein
VGGEGNGGPALKILVDLTHPAHVHFFKNAIHEWEKQGHELYIASRKKDVAIALIEHYGFSHHLLGRARKKGVIGFAVEFFSRLVHLFREVLLFRPDVMVAVGGAWIAPVGWVLRIPSVVFYGTEIATLNNTYVYPLADAVCTPTSYWNSAGKRHFRYKGNHELAYLQPARFIPDQSIVRKLGLSVDEPYIIVRTVAWDAHHDVGCGGFRDPVGLVRALENFGRVLITSEGALHPALEPNRIRIPPQHIHHVMAFARLFVGESSTMASESAMLGVPAILVSSTRRGFTDEEEKYGLVFTYDKMATAQEQALAKARELLSLPDLKETWHARLATYLGECVDVTRWIVDFVSRYDKGK